MARPTTTGMVRTDRIVSAATTADGSAFSGLYLLAIMVSRAAAGVLAAMTSTVSTSLSSPNARHNPRAAAGTTSSRSAAASQKERLPSTARKSTRDS